MSFDDGIRGGVERGHQQDGFGRESRQGGDGRRYGAHDRQADRVRDFSFEAGIEQRDETAGNHQAAHVMPLHKAFRELDHPFRLADEILIGFAEQTKPFVRDGDSFRQDVIEGLEVRTVGCRRRQHADVNRLGISHKTTSESVGGYSTNAKFAANSLKIYHEDANAAKPQSKVEISRKDAKAAKKIDCHFERKGKNKRYRLLTSIRVSPPLNKKWLRPQVDQPAMRVYPDAQRSCEATSERTRYERLRRYDGCFRFLS